MRRILPIVTSVLTFSLVITACTSAADSGEKTTATPSTNTTQTTAVPTDSSASPNSTSETPTTEVGQETGKSNSQTDAKQEEKDTSNQAKASTPASTKKPSTTTQTPTPAKSNTPTSTKPSTGGTSTSNSSLSAIEQEVVRLVNIERQKAGLKLLVADTKLSSVARIKSQDMRDNNYFDHQSPKYGSPFDMMKKFGISYRTAGENIAAGQTTAQQVMDSWMNSPGHRANILSDKFTKIGVGYVKGGSYGTYWTQQFTG